MNKLADREIKAGRMLDNGGLMPISVVVEHGVRSTCGHAS